MNKISKRSLVFLSTLLAIIGAMQLNNFQASAASVSQTAVTTSKILDLDVKVTTNTSTKKGVVLKSSTAQVGSIKNVYAISDYNEVRDVTNRQIMEGTSIANGNIRSWVQQYLGEDTRLVLTNENGKTGVYFVDLNGNVKKQTITDKDGKVTEGADLATEFNDDNRADQKIIEVSREIGSDDPTDYYAFKIGINHSGSNIDINFADDYGDGVNDWNPGMLFAIPAQTKLNVKWVDQRSGQDLPGATPVSLNLFSGDSYTTGATDFSGYKYAGRLKGKLTANQPISDSQLDISNKGESKYFDYTFDQSFLADYYVKRHLEVGESYTVILQDYIFPTDEPLSGDMIYRPIDMTVTRINENGDIKVTLNDLTTNDKQVLTIKHGESTHYSNENDYWHYYENNPDGPGYTARTIHNNLQLDNPQDNVFVYRKVASNTPGQPTTNKPKHFGKLHENNSHRRLPLTGDNMTASVWLSVFGLLLVASLLKLKVKN